MVDTFYRDLQKKHERLKGRYIKTKDELNRLKISKPDASAIEDWGRGRLIIKWEYMDREKQEYGTQEYEMNISLAKRIFVLIHQFVSLFNIDMIDKPKQ